MTTVLVKTIGKDQSLQRVLLLCGLVSSIFPFALRIRRASSPL